MAKRKPRARASIARGKRTPARAPKRTRPPKRSTRPTSRRREPIRKRTTKRTRPPRRTATRPTKRKVAPKRKAPPRRKTPPKRKAPPKRRPPKRPPPKRKAPPKKRRRPTSRFADYLVSFTYNKRAIDFIVRHAESADDAEEMALSHISETDTLDWMEDISWVPRVAYIGVSTPGSRARVFERTASLNRKRTKSRST